MENLGPTLQPPEKIPLPQSINDGTSSKSPISRKRGRAISRSTVKWKAIVSDYYQMTL